MALQRNVQQQNALIKEQMRRCAALLDDGDHRLWLQKLLREHGLEPSRGALVSLLQTPDQGGSFCSGIWVGEDHRFWEFSGTVCGNPCSFDLESMNEVTSEVAVTRNKPGTGVSFGQLAIEVLRERSETNASEAKLHRGASEA